MTTSRDESTLWSRRRVTTSRFSPANRLFVAGFLFGFPIPGAGALSAGSFLAPYILMGRQRTANRAIWAPVALLAIGILGYAIASGGHTGNFSLRGALIDLAMILTIVCIASMSQFDPNLISPTLCGCALAALVSVSLFGGQLQHTSLAYFWKYGAAFPVLVFALAWASRAASPFWPSVTILVAAAGISVIGNFRSQAIICALAAAYALALRYGRGRITARSIVILLVCLIPLLFLPTAIEKGYLGATIQAKTAAQLAEGGPLFLAGRPEPLLSTAAITANPILGYGTTRQIPMSAVLQAAQYARQLGFVNTVPIVAGWMRSANGVDLHSVLFTAWAEGGILAALFYFWLIAMAIRTLASPNAPSHTPLLGFVCMQILWDVLFSPFSNEMVPLWSMLVILFLATRTNALHRRLIS